MCLQGVAVKFQIAGLYGTGVARYFAEIGVYAALTGLVAYDGLSGTVAGIDVPVGVRTPFIDGYAAFIGTVRHVKLF